jgi:hypothetical protein
MAEKIIAMSRLKIAVQLQFRNLSVISWKEKNIEELITMYVCTRATKESLSLFTECKTCM